MGGPKKFSTAKFANLDELSITQLVLFTEPQSLKTQLFDNYKTHLVMDFILFASCDVYAK